MIKIIIFIILLASCSLGDKTGFWTNEKEIELDKIKINNSSLKKTTNEFNTEYKFELSTKNIKINRRANFDNNDGFTLFNGDLTKVKKFNFSKIENFHILEPNLVFYKDSIIFFDDKGSILNFNNKSKLNWKSNNYSREEKKLGPLLTMKKKNDFLIVTDNLAKYYVLDIISGKVLWSKKHKAPFNSQIKVFNDNFFVVDANNNLICFSILDGKKKWSYNSEKSFVNSSKQLSIIIKDKILVFTDSLGSINGLNLDNGSLLWQLPTQNIKFLQETINLKTSILIENENSIYFSNNKNNFYSLDLKTGIINWTQNISSDLKPIVVKNILISVSSDGYFFLIDKTTGNILRIIDIFKDKKFKKKKGIYPTGFIINFKNIFISTSNGRLIVMDIKSGIIENIIKIDSGKISKAFVDNQNMYLIKENSIIKIN